MIDFFPFGLIEKEAFSRWLPGWKTRRKSVFLSIYEVIHLTIFAESRNLGILTRKIIVGIKNLLKLPKMGDEALLSKFQENVPFFFFKMIV